MTIPEKDMPKTDAVKVSAVRGVEALQEIINNHDKLVGENDRMHTDCALLREKVNQLEARLATATTERDHYMRFSTEIITKLNDVEMIIDEAIRNAKLGPFRTPAAPTPKLAVPDIDTQGIEKLIKRLPVNGGQDAKD